MIQGQTWGVPGSKVDWGDRYDGTAILLGVSHNLSITEATTQLFHCLHDFWLHPGSVLLGVIVAGSGNESLELKHVDFVGIAKDLLLAVRLDRG